MNRLVVTITALMLTAACGVDVEGPDGIERGIRTDVSELTSAEFAPPGSGLVFLGLYRMKVRDGDLCLRHDKSFGACGTTADASSNDQFAIYQGNDNNYHLCLGTPPVIAGMDLCDNWEHTDATPDYGMIRLNTMRFIEYETGIAAPICLDPYSVPSFQAQCAQIPLSADGDVRKLVTFQTTVLSVRAGGTFVNNPGTLVAAEATPGSGEYFITKTPSPYTGKEYPYPMLGRNAKDSRELIFIGRKDEANRRWVPVPVPATATMSPAKKIGSITVTAPHAPTCSIKATPRVGAPTTVDVTWSNSTNGVSCLLTVDGKRYGDTVACGSGVALALTGQAPGNHKVGFSVGGAGGTGTCTANFTVPGLAACPSDGYGLASGSSLTCACSSTAASTGGVWGIDTYANRSSICRAAVHAGKLTLAGGNVTVYASPGLLSFDGNTRNGVTSWIYGSSPVTLTFVPPGTPIPPSLSDCPVTATAIDIGRSLACSCSNTATTRVGGVWGTDTYSGLSVICVAAVHAGKITTAGGNVNVFSSAGLTNYVGSARNGVTTSSYGPFSSTFSFDSVITAPVFPCPTNATGIAVGSVQVCSCSSAAALSTAPAWGTDFYTSDSPICSAAVHAGKITSAGGNVTVYRSAGMASYVGSAHNGVTTQSYGPGSGTFSFIGPSLPGNADCPSTAQSMPIGTSNYCNCTADASSGSRNVWGTDTYTSDSAICRAAVHAGKITTAGGKVTVYRTLGALSYVGSARYGVTTMSSGAYTGSFRF